MQSLTPEIARAAAGIKSVQLSADVQAHVRALPGTSLAELVSAIQQEPAERSVLLAAMCLCSVDGEPMFSDLTQGADEMDGWPQLWLVKIADAAGEANGLYMEADSDPESEPDA